MTINRRQLREDERDCQITNGAIFRNSYLARVVKGTTLEVVYRFVSCVRWKQARDVNLRHLAVGRFGGECNLSLQTQSPTLIEKARQLY